MPEKRLYIILLLLFLCYFFKHKTPHRESVTPGRLNSLLVLNKSIHDLLHSHSLLPPTPWKCKKNNNKRGKRAIQRSITWILSTILWHCSDHQVYKQLIFELKIRLNKMYSNVPHLQISQCNQIQQQMSLTRWQMRILRKLLRQYCGRSIVASESKINDYLEFAKLHTGSVDAIELELTKTEQKKKPNLLRFVTEVYHANTYNALQTILNTTMNSGSFYVERPLRLPNLIVEIGWDKSDGGLTESVALGACKKYHGKYGSLATLITNGKIAENYSNYRELGAQWNKREITNRLLKLPNMLILVKYCIKNQQIVSKMISTCVMTLPMNKQNEWNERWQFKLNNILPPRPNNSSLSTNDINNMIDGKGCSPYTKTFWNKKRQLLHLDLFYCIDLPQTFKNNLQHQYSHEQVTNMKSVAEDYVFPDEDCSEDDQSSKNSDRSISNESMSKFVVPDDQKKVTDYFTSWNGSGSDFSPSENEENDTDTPKSDWESDISNNNDVDNTTQKERQQRLYKLQEFRFNLNSNINRMDESEWKQKNNNVAASSLQSNAIRIVYFDSIEQDRLNNTRTNELRLVNGDRCDERMSVNLLFNDNGLSYFWLHPIWLSVTSNWSRDTLYTIGIVKENYLHGILVILISTKTDDVHLEDDMYHYKAYIQERGRLWDSLDVSNVNWKFALINKIIDKSNDWNLLRDIGTSKKKFDCNREHKLKYFSVELETYLQFDNKAKNITSGLSTSSSSHPCSICYVNRQQLKQYPTPSNFSFKTRTTQQSIENVINKPENARHKQGCKTAPIYDVPAHRRGPTTLHDMEGIYCVLVNTFRDCIVELAGESNVTNNEMLMGKIKDLNDKYSQIVGLQDILESPTNSDESNELKQNKIELQKKLESLRYEYAIENEQLNNEIMNQETNNTYRQFFQILQENKINTYYIMSGSIQGVMCSRINKAADSLINLVSGINETIATLWKLLFCNLEYVYNMSKHKSAISWSPRDILSIKQAYLDLYYQMVMVVNMWRENGSVGNKLHLLLHDLEHGFSKKRSPAFVDDQRFENFNQLLKAIGKLYDKYYRHDKLLHLGNRVNQCCLS